MEIKKITERVELNVAGQGCWNDCKKAKWTLKDAATNSALGSLSPCYKRDTAKKCWFW